MSGQVLVIIALCYVSKQGRATCVWGSLNKSLSSKISDSRIENFSTSSLFVPQLLAKEGTYEY